MSRYIWLNLLTVIFSIISLILQAKYVFEIVTMYNVVKQRYFTLKKNKKSHFSRLQDLNTENENSRAHLRINNDTGEESMDSLRSSINLGVNNQSNTLNSDSTVRESYMTLNTETTTDEVNLNWDDLTLSDKALIFNFWTFLIMLGDIMQISGSIFLSINTETTVYQSEVLLGFGALLAWISLIKYSENAKGYNIITNTIVNSSFVLSKAMIGILPVLIGFGLFALCFFSSNRRYGSIALSLFTLNAMANGDSVFDIWYATYAVGNLVGQIFQYLFMFLAICVIQNVFITIFGDGYAKSKFFHKNDWIKADEDEYKANLEEDPFAIYNEVTEKQMKSRRALVKMLKKDKEIVLEEYRRQRIESKLMKLDDTQEEKIRELTQILSIADMQVSSKSIEKQTRKICNLLKELEESYEEQKVAENNVESIENEYKEAIDEVSEKFRSIQQIQDKDFYI